jgi:hypothetical protein
MSLASDDLEHAVVVPGRHFAPTASAGLATAISGDEVEGDFAEARLRVAARSRPRLSFSRKTELTCLDMDQKPPFLIHSSAAYKSQKLATLSKVIF